MSRQTSDVNLAMRGRISVTIQPWTTMLGAGRSVWRGVNGLYMATALLLGDEHYKVYKNDVVENAGGGKLEQQRTTMQ